MFQEEHLRGSRPARWMSTDSTWLSGLGVVQTVQGQAGGCAGILRAPVSRLAAAAVAAVRRGGGAGAAVGAEPAAPLHSNFVAAASSGAESAPARRACGDIYLTMSSNHTFVNCQCLSCL